MATLYPGYDLNTDLDELDQKLEDLQARYAFQEDMIQSLNQLVADQQRELTELKRLFSSLKQSLDETMAEMDSLRPDTPPPHY